MKKLILLAAIAMFCGFGAKAQKVVFDDEIYTVIEVAPEFPGGVDSMYAFISRNIKYPEEALKNNVSGNVYVTFVVEKDGQITSTRLLRDIGAGCGQEALRVVRSMPKWKPGTSQGKPKRVQFNLPFVFTLP
ncbi:MAG: energy transducer TonB [Bacteroidales bacterium]|nr:energy transducer TonB [Bacteroidales bacterium]